MQVQRLPNLRRVFAWLLPLALVALPWVLNGFTVFQATQVLVMAIAIMGLNLLTGFSGQLSLGHGAFFAFGAYVAAYLLANQIVPVPVALVLSGLACLLLGLAFGFPALKLDGIYLALATFSLAVATPQLLKLSLLEHWTGGVGGIVLEKPQPPAFLPVNEDQWLYFIVLAVGLVLYALVRGLLAGRTGRAFLAVKDHPLAAQAMGIDVTRIKVLAFGYSALVTGLAGALSALVTQYVAPDSFPLFLSINLLVGMVVGGTGWIPGALFGALFIQIMPILVEHISQGLQGVIYGLVLIGVMLVAPGGLGALARR